MQNLWDARNLNFWQSCILTWNLLHVSNLERIQLWKENRDDMNEPYKVNRNYTKDNIKFWAEGPRYWTEGSDWVLNWPARCCQIQRSRFVRLTWNLSDLIKAPVLFVQCCNLTDQRGRWTFPFDPVPGLQYTCLIWNSLISIQHFEFF